MQNNYPYLILKILSSLSETSISIKIVELLLRRTNKRLFSVILRNNDETLILK